MAARFFPEYGGGSPPNLFGRVNGSEGEAALDSALNVARQPYYPRLHDKAGVLLRSLIKNHPFIDGNKRIALVTTFDFLLMNGHVLFATNKEMVRFALELASSEPDIPWDDVATWIRRNCIAQNASDEQVQAKLEGRPRADRQQIDRFNKILDEVEAELELER